MNLPDANTQPDMFEKSLVKTVEEAILDLLNDFQQPSAEELLTICMEKYGEQARDNIKEAVLNLAASNDLPIHKKEYLIHLIEDSSLDKAIVGKDDCHEKKEINTGIDTLIAKSKAYRNSEDFRELIQFMGKFRDYAPYNNMLVRVQNPSCGFYATAKEWQQRFGRTIVEDARPMLILAPMHPVMLVYDLDSTEGKELPKNLTSFSKFEGGWESKWLKNLVENANRHKIRVNFKILSSSNSGFATRAGRDSEWKMRIVIHDVLDEPSRFGVLCHELAHILLGHLGGDKDLWWPSRLNLDHHSMEIEAESTAYIAIQQLELTGSSAAYISCYLKEGERLPEGVSLDNIAKVSGKIGQMAKGKLPGPKPKRERQEKNQ